MNDHNIDFQQQTQAQNYGLIGNCNMGIQQPAIGGSSSTIINRFESPASAFYAAERCMGFPQNDHFPSENQFSRIYEDNFSPEQNAANQFTNTLQSMVKSGVSDNPHQYDRFSGKISKVTTGSSFPQSGLISHEDKLFEEIPASFTTDFSIPFQANQDPTVCYGSYKSPFGHISFSSNPKKVSTRYIPGSVSGSSNSSDNYSSSGAVLSSKTRIRWTQELHGKFVSCVNSLGGAEKATPKAILKLMDTDGLTIFHVKSHLQKYRNAKYMPDFAEGRYEKRSGLNDIPQLDTKTGLQIREALQLQLDVQRRLHEQLETQRKLQLQIEEQGRQLKLMFDQQQKTNKCLFTTHDLDSDSPELDSLSNCLVDAPVLIADPTGNTQFPSKIS